MLTASMNQFTLTTLELALPCSYILRALLTRGICDILLTKSGSTCAPSDVADKVEGPDILESVGLGTEVVEIDEAEIDNAGVGVLAVAIPINCKGIGQKNFEDTYRGCAL